MKDEIRVLLVEDSQDDAVFIINELEKGGLKIQHKRVDTAREMRDALTKDTWDAILCDYSIPGFGAIPALALLKEIKCDIPVIIISGVIGEDTAVETMLAGAHDFIVKGKYARLVPAVKREIEEYVQRKAREVEVAKQKAEAAKQRQLSFTMIMQNPQPLLIIDTKFNIKLANEAFLTLSGFSEEHLQKMSIRDFKILNKSGHNLKEAIETKKGVTGQVTVQFPAAIHNLEQHTIPLLDKEGEIVSIMAVYNDLTEKLAEEAKREELANYITAYLSSMADNLTKLSKGNLDFNLEISPASKTTEEARQWFMGINKNLAEVKEALSLLVSDTDKLSKAAVEGKLQTRADAGKHQGDFKKVVEGVNQTLDAVIAPVNEALRISLEYANCNFAARMDEDLKVSGDFQKFKNALNNIGIEVSKAVVLINRQVAELGDAAQAADGGVNDISTGAAQIAKNTGQVSQNAEKSDLGIEQVLKAMSDLSSTVEEVATSMESVAGMAKNTDMLSADGVKLANKANQSMGRINESTKIVDTNILEINNKMKEIGNIVKLIRDIANQTNLLALNAAIEAARAGDAGRGFAVVAAEVKSLAQESRGSAENIAAMIEDLQKRSKRSAEAVVQASEQVTQGSRDVEDTLTVFNKIVESVAKISQSSSDVAAATEEQAASVEEITASVHEVSSLIQGTTKEAGDAAAATQEASAALDEITKVVGKVNTIVANVSSEMAKFRI
jgi:methyl-accepting chemotaxis protein